MSKTITIVNFQYPVYETHISAKDSRLTAVSDAVNLA